MFDGKEFLFEYTLRVTKLVDYGTALQPILAGVVVPPPEGARFDVQLEGALTGPTLNGSIHGSSYGNIRADRRLELHAHAQIDTPDGARISMITDSVGTRDAAGTIQVRENVTLKSNAPAYTWVNALQIWGSGTATLAEEGEIRVVAFKA